MGTKEEKEKRRWENDKLNMAVVGVCYACRSWMPSVHGCRSEKERGGVVNGVKRVRREKEKVIKEKRNGKIKKILNIWYFYLYLLSKEFYFKNLFNRIILKVLKREKKGRRKKQVISYLISHLLL